MPKNWMREQTRHAFWHLTPKETARYTPRSLNVECEEQEHEVRMALEKARAVGYMSIFSNLNIDPLN
jgi:hypothetical protein